MGFSELGYELLEGYLSPEQLRIFDIELGAVKLSQATGGIRNAEKLFESVNEFKSSKYALDHASAFLSGAPKFVRAILFNKTPANNWLVSWHQDKTIAVSSKFSKEGWGPWSEKDGVVHVQPPLEVLNSMITFRIHLDEATVENGCLSVVPGSHELGILKQQNISRRLDASQAVVCEAQAGSALVMRPNLLHSSGKGTAPSTRRVLHIEYSSYELPEGIFWAKNT